VTLSADDKDVVFARVAAGETQGQVVATMIRPFTPTPEQIAVEAAKLRATALARKRSANPKVIDRPPLIFADVEEIEARTST